MLKLVCTDRICRCSERTGRAGKYHIRPTKANESSDSNITGIVVKVTIATVGSFLGPPTDHYKVGDQIPVTTTMTNPASSAQYACISGNLYQNLPTLIKDGAPVPYMQWQSYERLNAQRNHVCEHENLPQTVLLRPNEPKAADWFVLVDNATSTGAEAWYDSLPPGKYQLSCDAFAVDGPMVESN